MRNPGLVLLAAGESTRMGSPKQLLPWKGSTLLRHACEVALETGCSPVLVVLGCQSRDCLRELEGLSVNPIINPNWKNGMGSSLASGITALEEAAPNISGALIMLVDQPTVTSIVLKRLLEFWSSSPQPIIATKYENRGGVPAIFSATYFKFLKALNSDQGARSLIAKEISHVLLVDPDSELIDLDTQEAYQKHLKECR